MTSSQRVHLQELYDKKHLAVVEAYRANPHHPDFSKREFYNFLIEKYQDFNWPWWSDGQPVHEDCQKTLRDNERRERLHQLTGGAKIMEHEHLYHKPTPISDNAKVEYVPIGVARQLERSSRELAASNYELQSQNILLMQSFSAFVLATRKFVMVEGNHRHNFSEDDTTSLVCPICAEFSLALAVAKLIVSP
jgi:hypothetical protein